MTCEREKESAGRIKSVKEGESNSVKREREVESKRGSKTEIIKAGKQLNNNLNNLE